MGPKALIYQGCERVVRVLRVIWGLMSMVVICAEEMERADLGRDRRGGWGGVDGWVGVVGCHI